MTLPAEVKKAFHISKQLFAEPGMMERASVRGLSISGQAPVYDAGASFSCWKGQQRGKGFSGRA